MNFGQIEEAKTKFLFNEVTTLTGVKPYVLRFWESEFTQISPVLENNEKYYQTEDIRVISVIKTLLFDEKLSIPEVKGVLDERLNQEMSKEGDEQQVCDEAQELNFDAQEDTTIEPNLNAIDISKAKLKELAALIENIEKKHCWI